MTTPTSTLGLIERAKGGDTEAFSLLFHKYRKRLAVLIYYRMSSELQNHAEVDDILQETFLEASRHLDRFAYRAPGSFMAWLARIADHAIVDTARHYARQKRDGGQAVALRSESNPGGADPSESNTPSRILFRQERVRAMLDRIDALPPDQREVILLAKFEELSTPEIAARMGKSREAVAVLLHRALTRLRHSSPETNAR